MSANNNKNSSRKLRRAVTFLMRCALFIAVLLPVYTLAASGAEADFDDDARWFQVELILFSHQTDLALDAEQWPAIKGLTLPEKLLELHLPTQQAPADERLEPTDDRIVADPAGMTSATDDPTFDVVTEDDSDMPVAYQILPGDQLQLTGMAEQLQRSANRELLLHIAWQQPTYDRKNAQPVYFAAGMNEPLSTTEDESETVMDGNLPGVPENALANQPILSQEDLLLMRGYPSEKDLKIGPADPRFTGTVTLSVERYLHVATDLLYRQAITQHKPIPVPDLDLWYDRPYPTLQEPQGPAFQQATWQAIRGFQHKESRRMRSTEIHYLDHPFMGMVVVITPVELPEPAEEIQQTSPQNILSTPSRVRKTP